MRAAVVLAVLLTGCQTTWREGAKITLPSGERLCAKHRIPLQSLRAWHTPTHGERVILVHDAGHPYYGIAAEYCPNHIPEHISFARGGVFQERTTVYYCARCEKEFRERLRVPDQKAAREFAEYVLSIRSGVETKGPYEIRLAEDVWTVKCLLADGRPASIKIGKETGLEMSTDFRR